MRILAGDIGGTSTRLAVYLWSGERLRRLVGETFPSRSFSGLHDVVDVFLMRTGERCERACFALAGPVTGTRVATTNLPWTVDARELESAFGFERTFLVNDLEAVGWGIGGLAADGIRELAAGSGGARGNGAVIAAGTGLGEAGLYWDGSCHRPFACEGGHATFAPGCDEEWQLQRFLAREHDHVSWERVVSGPGLVAIYRFLRERAAGSAPVREDPAAIAEAGLAKSCPVAERALRLFARLYGAETGNLALKVLATGGVWVAGGIAPKIIDALADGEFIEGFTAKGRMRSLLEGIPVRVIMSSDAAPEGAARRAVVG